ncbi:MAG: hypothetical protein IPP31_10000 [Chitinophagaceae bacterium]|nr:hypothetical protein [Chitinophagaceae bacterium]
MNACAGRPVITSYFTPWNDLEKKKAGWNLDIRDPGQCLERLKAICEMGPLDFGEYCQGANLLAKEYYESMSLDDYKQLFSKQTD